MKRFAQIFTLAACATFALTSFALAGTAGDDFLNYNDFEEMGPQGAYGMKSETAADAPQGILPVNLVFDNTSADFDKSPGCCLLAPETSTRTLTVLGDLDRQQGIGH